jgi:hypothetical protein
MAVEYFAVPQYAPLIEASACVGAELGAELAAAGELRRGGRHGLLGVHAVVALAAALSGLKHRPKTEEHPILGLANDVQAVVALARLGIGTDARWPPGRRGRSTSR